MYRAFNLTISDCSKLTSNGITKIDKLADIVREVTGEGSAREVVAANEANAAVVKKVLDDFLNKDNAKIDGTKMREHWFPQINADVFISHSHSDRDNALNLASFLKRDLKLDSFIDSCVWGYSADLLRQIDEKYCWFDEKKTMFNYELRNCSTNHVHMMLSTALAMMIDTAECVIFMNTPESVSCGNSIQNKTSSPWIYYELSMMSLIRRRKLEDYRPKEIIENFAKVKRGAYAALPIEHTISLGALTAIGANHLTQWAELRENPYKKESHSLDLLYEIAPKVD